MEEGRKGQGCNNYPYNEVLCRPTAISRPAVLAFKFNRERGHENPPGGKIIKINRRGGDVEGKEEKEGRKERKKKGVLRCTTRIERINTHLTRAEIDGPGLRVLQPPPSLPVGGRAIPLSLVKFRR